MKLNSPLRYPGGKSQMYEYVKEIICKNNLQTKTYVEPFAGGFGIGIKLLKEKVVEKAIINDFDFRIYAFWKAVFFNSKKLIDGIKDLEISIDEWKKQKMISKKCPKKTYLKVAISTLFLNRTNFSGILKGNPIGGISQNGKYKMDCRFPKEKIIEAIHEISKFKDRVKIYNLDAKEFILKILNKNPNSFFINFDPPYVKNGKSLYTNFYETKDHKELKTEISNLKSDWIMTYDCDNLILKEYAKYPIKKFNLRYSAKNKIKGTELFISKKEYINSIQNIA